MKGSIQVDPSRNGFSTPCRQSYPSRRLKPRSAGIRRILLTLVFAVPVLLGQTPKQRTSSSSQVSALTVPSNQPPREIGLGFLTSSSGLASDNLSSIYLAREHKIARNGVTRLVYRQRFQGIDVYNGAWVVNIGPDGAVLNAGGMLYPGPGIVNFDSQVQAARAVRAAAREVNPRLAARYSARDITAHAATGGAAPAKSDRRRFAAGDFGADIEGRLVWYAHRGTLLLTWLFNIVDEDGVSGYDVAVEAATGAVIEKKATTFFQSAPTGRVFDKGTPMPNPTPGMRLSAPPPAVERNLLLLEGDPVASPEGWVVNNETAGYNAIVGENVLGQPFATVPRTQAASGSFSFPLALGPTAANPLAYPDAANVNLFYWINQAHDLFYRYGFDEAAGNFQSDNYGRGGLGGDALLAYTHFGAAATSVPSLNNAFFSTRSLNDGSPSMVGMFATITGPSGFFADGAYAADVIVHEYTHGVSLRLLPDGYGSFQTAAMGEAWSDFFGLEFTTPEGSPAWGVYPTGEYWNQSWGTGIRTRPYSSDMDVNPLTYDDLGHVTFSGPQVHADGEIWAEVLWEARASLIGEFGEIEGRRRIRQLVIDGLMLSVPSPSMVDARDAILLADQVDFGGTSQNAMWNAFAKRGLGALAHSDGGDTIHVIPSFDKPSPAAKLKFYENTYVAGEPIRLVLSDSNLSQATALVVVTTTSGDQENLILRRSGSIYFALIPSTSASVSPQNGVVNLVPGDAITASYTDSDSGAVHLFGNLPAVSSIQATASTQQSYAITIGSSPAGIPSFPGEIRLTSIRVPVPVNLSFDFPFFSRQYRSMVVYPTGAVGFEPSIYTNPGRAGCNDTVELSRIAAIAPLFSNLTFGTAQPNEGVFVSYPARDTIAIRWAAETIALLPPAEPVNFAVTLRADGSITFYYGSGNQNLSTAAQTLSTCGAQPTVGISPGHDVYTRTFTQRSYDNGSSVTFSPPFNASTAPVVALERPATDETVRGVIRVSGIAYDPGQAANRTFVSRRDVFIDGIQRSVATTVSRPDYCATNPVPGCPTVGFQSELNVAGLNLAPGPHTIYVRVTNTRGAIGDSAPVSFNVDAAPARLPKGAIETPVADAQLQGSIQFRGYAYADDLRISRVDMLIDGVTYPGIAYGAPRPDICGTLPAPVPLNCPAVGWLLNLNTRTGAPPLPDGAHSMQLRVLDESGRFTLLPHQPVPFAVTNGPQALPAGALTSIKPNERLSDIVNVSGYAYSPTGRVIGVVLLVDGSAVGVVQYGQPRPAECETLPGVAACPNIGFSIDLDTRTLTNGDHVIGVRVVNDSGLSITVPNLNRNGMNVVVDNRELH